jgi:hypothetical protein
MRVIIRGFTEAEYHKDIAYLDEQQIRMTSTGIDDACVQSLVELNGGCGVTIKPSQFPEMVRFEVLIQKGNK